MEQFLAGVIVTFAGMIIFSVSSWQRGWIQAIYEKFAGSLRVKSIRQSNQFLQDGRDARTYLSKLAVSYGDLEALRAVHMNLNFSETQRKAGEYMAAAADIMEAAQELAGIYQHTAALLAASGTRFAQVTYNNNTSIGRSPSFGMGGVNYSPSMPHQQAAPQQAEATSTRFEDDEEYYGGRKGDREITALTGRELNNWIKQGLVLGKDFFVVPKEMAK